MSNGTDKRSRRNGDAAKWIGVVVGILVLVGSIVGVWVGSSNQDAKQDVRIEHVESQVEDLKSMPSAIAEMRVEQRTMAEDVREIKQAIRDLKHR